ncbi:sigma-E factor negative regulatory protein [Aliidiomarina quisquiliarum]|uniref:sigma-E factor negative regulatory protein n=1 Tax=Aliidiomarina quisquiliarum TaxID=2938947 RepID=UPI00208EB9E3|nr:RseA family anti-sigma factor [Aliidiomarina quisquiliarum]MCO4320576.1 RseA family anti-sigma factor [Aliidiomarina quisquiliarum]
MTDNQYEYMSALMDSELEQQPVNAENLNALVRNDDMRTRWQHYHLIGAMLRNEAKTAMPMDISAAVAEQVAAEPVIIAPKHGLLRKAQLKSWLKPAANIAIAASVALVTVLGVTQYQRVDDGSMVATEQSSRGFQPALQTVPLGVVGNPLSYNASQAQPTAAQESLSAQQQARLQSQVQAFMVDHQLQLQWHTPMTISEQVKPAEKEIHPENEEPLKPRPQ